MLVSVLTYQRLTGDVTTAASAVSALIEEATDELAEALNRVVDDEPALESAERTERLHSTRDGMLWPSAIPITDAPGWTIDGWGLRGTSVPPQLDIVGTGVPSGIEVTYTGGWTETTVPRSIARDIARAAFVLGHPTAMAAGDIDTSGAASIAVGDVRVSWPTGRGAPGTDLSDRLGAVWSRRTLSYRHRVDRGVPETCFR